MTLLNLLVFLFCLIFQTVHSFDYKYHNYADLTQLMNYYASTYPNVTYLYSVGKSVQGRELWTLALAKNNPSMHVPLRPEAKYIGAMHGNEVPSKEILISLIDHMLTNQADPDVDFLLSNTRVHIMPSMNPDGYEINATLGECDTLNGRHNANDYDLNRNFPDLFEPNPDPIQPETQAILDWLDREDFVVSANFHGGILLVNYPFDNFKGANESSGTYAATSDDDVFRAMAKSYSLNHPQMRDVSTAPCGNEFTDGITNGAEWYAILGGMQDINYWRYGCMETTVEVSCCKFPDASSSELEEFWRLNKKSLIEYLKSANTGVRGIVSFKDGTVAKHVTVKIGNREPFFKTNKNGEFFRVLLPGRYNLTVAFNCDSVYQTNIEISASSRLLEFNVTLNECLMNQYKRANMTRYAVFCGNSSSYIPCVDSHQSKIDIIVNFFKAIWSFLANLIPIG